MILERLLDVRGVEGISDFLFLEVVSLFWVVDVEAEGPSAKVLLCLSRVWLNIGANFIDSVIWGWKEELPRR
jgi:hypothetical protein